MSLEEHLPLKTLAIRRTRTLSGPSKNNHLPSTSMNGGQASGESVQHRAMGATNTAVSNASTTQTPTPRTMSRTDIVMIV